MKVYTRKGDQGETSLLGGSRVSKDHDRIEAYGTVDELNSHIGLLISMLDKEEYASLEWIQNKLFDLGSLLALEKKSSSFDLKGVDESDIVRLEAEIDKWEEALPSLKNFILPGGSMPSAQAHVCRTVCRRSERTVVKLSNSEEGLSEIIGFLNRLSDYFFVLARIVLSRAGEQEIHWKSDS